MSDSYGTFEEFADALQSVRRRLRTVVRLFVFVVVTIIAGFAGLFYFAHDLPRQASMFDSNARSLEKQGAEVKLSIKLAGAELKAELTGLSEKIEKVERDVARLTVRLDATDRSTAPGTRDDPSSSMGEQNRNDSAKDTRDSAIAPQDATVANGITLSPPLPRPRKAAQTAATPRAAPAASDSGSAGPVELKVGNQISAAQFDLQPIPDELENKIPRLKGKVFFRHVDQIFVVDPKDNRIIELLR